VDETDLRLRAPMHLVSPRARAYWTVRALLGWLAALVVLAFVVVPSPAPAVPILGAAIVVAGCHVVVMPQWRYRVHRWEVSDTAVYTQSGWITQERRIAPVARIQTVDTERGPIEQVFGLANLTVTTASAAGPLKIHGLDRGVADGLVDDLTTRTNRFRGDGT
jgi:uncharacterized protein